MLPPCTKVEETVLDLIQARGELRRRVRMDMPDHRAPAYHGGPDTAGHGRAQEDALAPGTQTAHLSGSPALVPILAQLAAIDAELAGRAGQQP